MAAQNWGNCQICGREHKVSGQTIAKHGYTVRNGWQEGACYGSGGKPIQISCDLIEGAIESAKRYIDSANEKISKLAASPLDDEGQMEIMVSRQTRTGHMIYPVRVKVELNDRSEPVAVDRDGKKVKSWPLYTGVKTVEAAAKELAVKQTAYFEGTIEQANESISFMTDRLKDWKPSELRAISSLDRAAEAPKVHFSANKYGRKNTGFCAGSAMGAQRLAGSNTTTNRDEVTCAACLKALKEADEAPARRAAEKEKERLREIKSLEKDVKEYSKWIKQGNDDPMVIVRWTEMLNKTTADLEKLKAEQ